MTNNQFAQTVNAIQQLPTDERIELLKATFEQLLTESRSRLELIELITRLLQEANLQNIAATTPQQGQDFWHPKTLNQHITEQQVTFVRNLDDVAMDLWPQDETADDFIDFVYQQRHLYSARA